ncbi:hypothetical protein PCL_02910 [Purpureocillium lilacinum]|uniref:Uncharacterized protein n=1 Tax=Purpureocillium lilacinum TaxID=33203 RepID=A0A2U3DZA8_PURLI|nr:hypothetical protein PCL_02910 [Purpureocillium lilacinum]
MVQGPRQMGRQLNLAAMPSVSLPVPGRARHRLSLIQVGTVLYSTAAQYEAEEEEPCLIPARGPIRERHAPGRASGQARGGSSRETSAAGVVRASRAGDTAARPQRARGERHGFGCLAPVREGHTDERAQTRRSGGRARILDAETGKASGHAALPAVLQAEREGGKGRHIVITASCQFCFVGSTKMALSATFEMRKRTSIDVKLGTSPAASEAEDVQTPPQDHRPSGDETLGDRTGRKTPPRDETGAWMEKEPKTQHTRTEYGVQIGEGERGMARVAGFQGCSCVSTVNDPGARSKNRRPSCACPAWHPFPAVTNHGQLRCPTFFRATRWGFAVAEQQFVVHEMVHHPPPTHYLTSLRLSFNNRHPLLPPVETAASAGRGGPTSH